MKKYELIICALLFSFSLYGQSDLFNILYTNTTSGIQYQKEEGATARVFSGLSFPPKGELVFEDKAWANIIYLGKKRKIEGPVTVDLKQLAAEIESDKTTFFGRFWNYLGNSMSPASSKEDLSNYNKSQLAEARAGTSGFGEKDFQIQVPFYFSGIISNPEVTLKWESPDVLDGFQVEIRKRKGKELVLQARTVSNSMKVNLSELFIKSGEVYYWQVTATKEDTIKLSSSMEPFSYQPEALNEAVAKIRKSEVYNESDQAEKLAYELYKLEEERFFLEVKRSYETYLDENPEDLMYRKLYAAFLARMNDLESANSLMEF